LEDWEKLDEFRMQEAVRELTNSANLRFLFRSILAMTGATGTPFGSNPHEMAQAVGRHSVGTDLMQTLMTHQPTLIGSLLTEDADEATARDQLTLETPDNVY